TLRGDAVHALHGRGQCPDRLYDLGGWARLQALWRTRPDGRRLPVGVGGCADIPATDPGRRRQNKSAPCCFAPRLIQRRGPEGFIVRICALASGSSGKSTVVATERTRLLVDAGLSFKDTCNRMLAIGEDPFKLDAILVTHEHSDHVGGLPRLAKKLGIPVYMTWLTAPAIEWL